MTAGQAAYAMEQNRRGHKVPWDMLTEAEHRTWELIAAAARAWEPAPEPTLGEIAQAAYEGEMAGPPTAWSHVSQPNRVAWQAAGEAAAAVGAAKERREIRQALADAYGEDPEVIDQRTINICLGILRERDD